MVAAGKGGPTMKVGLINPPKGNNVRGVGYYIDHLYEALKQKNIDVSRIDYSLFAISYNPFDIIHFPYFSPFFLDGSFALLYPFAFSKKIVVTVHDLTPLKFPEHFPLGKRAKIVWPIQKNALKLVNAICTDSECSRRDITEITGVGDINVTYLAADCAFKPIKDVKKLKSIKVKYSLPNRFAMYLGGANWNKNLPTLIRACDKIKMPLILVGKELMGQGADFSNIENQPLKFVIDSGAIKLGFVPDEDLVALFNLASVYVQPSYYEGFGLPVLQAMAVGTPVICGKVGSLPEIAGEAATYVDITSVDKLALAIKNVKKTGCEIAQTKKFSWDKTATETIKIYETILR